MNYRIALDGPSGAGKSTIAKRLSAELGFVYVDTGAMYRSIGLYCLQNNIDTADEMAVTAVLPQIDIQLKYIDGEQRVILNGTDVSKEIRINEVSMAASKVSAYKAVRAFLLDTQRDIAKEHSVIMDGRDIATVVLPDADVKIFLTADPKKRAERRFEELKAKNPEITFESVYNDMVTRDKNDSTRAVAPTVKADDATLLDNTYFNEEETVNEALRIIYEKVGEI